MSLNPTPGAVIPHARGAHHGHPDEPMHPTRRTMPQTSGAESQHHHAAHRRAERPGSAYEIIEREHVGAKSTDAESVVPGPPAGGPVLATPALLVSHEEDGLADRSSGIDARPVPTDAAATATAAAMLQSGGTSHPTPSACSDLEQTASTGRSLPPQRPETASSPGTVAADAQRISNPDGYARHYGSLPVLFSGELVELDLYALERQFGAVTDAARRLVLSLSDTRAGSVRLLARASANRLQVSLTGAATAFPEAASEHVLAVSQLAARLGWKFEAVERAPDWDDAGAFDPEPKRSGPGQLDRLL